MIIDNKDFKELKDEIKDIRDRVMKIEGRSGSVWKEYIPVTALILSMLTGAYVFNERLTKAEEAIKALSHQQSEATQNLIRDLLAAATVTDNSTTATKALSVASDLTAGLRAEKRPASPQFFETTLEKLSQNNNPALSPIKFQLQDQLAEYRSALQPPLPPSSADINCSGITSESAFKHEGTSSGQHISNAILRGCPQILDGFIWENVTFVNSHIVYRGGQVALVNVRFINCTFDVVGSAAGPDILRYATLDQKQLTFTDAGAKPS